MATDLVRGLVGSLLLISSASAMGAAQVPINSFFTRHTYTQPRISPSGRFLAVVGPDPQDVESNLLDIVDLKNMTLFRSLKMATDPNIIFDTIRWVSDERLVVSTATRRAGGFDRPVLTGKVFTIDVEHNDLRLLQENKSGRSWTGYQILKILPDDPYHVITGSYSRWKSPRAYRIDLRGNRNQMLANWGQKNPNIRKLATSPLENGRLFADHEGQIRLAVGFDVATGAAQWSWRSTEASAWKSLPADLLDPAFDVGPVGATPDDKELYLLEYAPSDTLGLYRYNPATDTKALIYDDPRADIDRTDFYDGLIFGPEHKDIVAVITMPGRPHTVLLHKAGPAARILKAFGSGFPDKFSRIVSWTNDGSKAVVSVSAGRDPGTYYLVDAKTLHAKLLLKQRPDIDPVQMAPVEPIEFKSRDGATIHGYLTLPDGVQPKNLPMIVYVHGGPHGVRDQWEFDPMVQLLANRGYAVLQVNYRGSAGYGWTYEKTGFRHWGTTMQYDVIDGTRWAVKQGYANAKRICIFGGSYGGFAALRSSELAPDLYRCTVGYDGVYDLPMMFKKGDITWQSAGPYYLRYVLGTDMADLKDQSPVSHVGRLKSAIFLIQGGMDNRAPPAQVDELKAALDKAGKHYDYLYKANEGHGFTKLADQRELAQKLLDFFARNIGSSGG